MYVRISWPIRSPLQSIATFAVRSRRMDLFAAAMRCAGIPYVIRASAFVVNAFVDRYSSGVFASVVFVLMRRRSVS